ncbi:hypothetical protein AJ80_00913 [Polytolypa hystricis UAMH7299]|uniref:Ubiquitin carboxyl-terminal hydrolase n=1 Tax=Polytolypa hystricis (strain UAMH7299) TaxID=1447883 RepID=A0A2B7Z1G4_POLH7|nr:hypothetical protein AJ80_00913 [Polytolypa hystricis UAMH7299]
MPDKPATIAAYAAGASLAAITLFYVFGPNYTIDGEDSNNSGRKKGIVGLSNPANDCFINSVLQALAGLGDLRVYLIRELHRRQHERPEIYNALLDAVDVQGGEEGGEGGGRGNHVPRANTPEKIRELQLAPVTQALKVMLDRLNERPIYKKTISARGFIQALEYAFHTRISRNQQDAQEFLQIVAERLCDEYHAGVKARERAARAQGTTVAVATETGDTEESEKVAEEITIRLRGENEGEEEEGAEEAVNIDLDTPYEEGFPFEGKLESQVECQFCRYTYKPNQTSFVNLTLQVPQRSSTSLNACFDNLLKTEDIDDFRCDSCGLQFALKAKRSAIRTTTSGTEVKRLEKEISLIEAALANDPETPPKDVRLPDPKDLPRRKIARSMRITVFPRILTIHLSRSIFDQTSSTKNAAKVAFPERLALGSILDRKYYKLLGIVCHKGSHHSGHYESFRRNPIYPPFSTPDVFRSYSQSRAGSQNPSTVPSPKIKPPVIGPSAPDVDVSPLSITPSEDVSSASVSTTSLPLPGSRSPATIATSSPRPTTAGTPQRQKSSSSLPTPRTPSNTTAQLSPSSTLSATTAAAATPTTTTSTTTTTRFSTSDSPNLTRTSKDAASLSDLPHSAARLRRKKRTNERWWRISDEKIKECKTSDVLGMQKEVYLLFYELEKPGDRP